MMKQSVIVLVGILSSTSAFAGKDVSENCQVFAGAMGMVAEGSVASVEAAQKADIKPEFAGEDLSTAQLPEVLITDNKMKIDLSRDSIFGKDMRSKTIATGKVSLRDGKGKPAKYELIEKGDGTAEEEIILTNRDNVSVKVRIQLRCTYTKL